MRRFFQFRVTTLFLLVGICALAFAWWADHRKLKRKLDHAELIRRAQRLAQGHESDASIAFYLKTYQADLDRQWWRRHDVRPYFELFDRPDKTADGIPSFGAVSRLVQLLRDNDATTRARAAKTLAQLGVNAEEAVPALAEALNDDDPTVKWHAIGALECIGPKALAAAPALAKFMRRDASPGAVYAARALLAIDPQADVVPRLIELLGADDFETRRQAANRLRRMGPTKVDAVPRLVELFDDPNESVRSAAIEAVGELASPEEGVLALKRLFENSQNEALRRLAARALMRIDVRASGQQD